MEHDNKPLTVDQMREMHDEVVIVKTMEYSQESKGILDFSDPNDSDNGVYVGCSFYSVEHYGDWWLAYEQKPEDLLTRADKAMEDTIALYLIEHDADDRKRWRSFNKLIHQRKQQLESAQQQLEGVLDMFEREYRMI